MPNQKLPGGGWGGGSSGGMVRASAPSRGAVKVNRPLTKAEIARNKAAETYKTKTTIKDPKRVEQGKKNFTKKVVKAKKVGRTQSAGVTGGLIFLAGDSKRKKSSAKSSSTMMQKRDVSRATGMSDRKFSRTVKKVGPSKKGK